MKYYLGIDQGTTGTTVMVFDENFNSVSKGYKEHTQFYPKPGWVEHDPFEIFDRVLDATDLALKKAGISATDIRAIGIDNQGETVMLWNKKTGLPVYNAIVWQDKRTSDYCEELKKNYEELIRDKTGLVIDSYFSATKIKWVIDNVDGVKEGIENNEIIAGTLDSWLIWKLTGGKNHFTDHGTAARTMLFNINTAQWDDELLEIMEIPKSILPEIKDSIGFFGKTDPNEFFGAEVPITASLVDQGAALFGQACFNPGNIKTTYGTGAFMLLNTGNKKIDSTDGLLTSVSWSHKGKLNYILEAGIYITGAATQWLRDGIRIIGVPAATEAIAMSVEDNGGVYFVPAFSGLAAPHWDQYARGAILGITGGTTREHIVRATLESTAYQIKDNLELMEKAYGEKVEAMRVDGGATANNFLMQFQSDVLGIPVDLPEVNEATSLGVAQMAALGVEDFESIKDFENMWKLKKRFSSRMEKEERNSLMNNWYKAVSRARGWADA
jgi:glycerol kinase